MTFGQFLLVLRARWRAAALVLLTIVVVTAGLSIVWPKKYAATASVVVDGKPDPLASALSPGIGLPQLMATQVDILNSERVAQRAVRNLKLADNPQVRAQWLGATGGQGTIETWLAENFQRNIEVKPSRESNVITVTSKAPDAKFAAALANAFVQAYIDVTLDMRVNPAKEYSNFFDGRLKEARDTLERAQAKLSEFQREKGITAADERLDVENSRLNELSSQLVAIQAIASESASRQTQAQGGAGDRVQEVLNNPLIAGIKADLNRAEATLQQLSARLGDRHPQVIEAKVNVTELRTTLEAETKRVTGGVTVSNTINRQREAAIRAELEAQRAKVLRLKAVRDEGQVLSRDVENAQRAYDAVQVRLTQASLESQSKLANVYPLTEATPPLSPASPRIYLNLLVAVFVGTLAACGVAMALELTDRRVRSSLDLATALGIPVVALLPDGDKPVRSTRRHDALARQQLVSPLGGSAGAKA